MRGGSNYHISFKKKLFEDFQIELESRTIEKMIQAFNRTQDDYEIKRIKSNHIKFYFHSLPQLEVAEAKAIIDMIYSSKFFSKTVKNNFIKRMQSYFNFNDQNKLNKSLDIHRVGNENDYSFFISYDSILNAINQRKKITFDYSKEAPNSVSPISKKYTNIWPIETVYENNAFYVCGYDETENIIKNFRIDFINNVKVLSSFVLDEALKEKAIKKIKDSTYGYSPERYVNLELRFAKELYTNIIDKFSRNINTPKSINEKEYIIEIENCPISSTFYAWIIGFGGKIKINFPEEEVQAFKMFLNKNFIKD